ncbi:MAG: FkbM family methyltransferase [Bacteroidota bacterium]|nr:FkbM family methyltransferase [Bacteroidota bacterium]
MSNTVDLKIFHPYQVEGLQRLGNKHDGGYVVHVPSLQYVDCLLNYGVGYNVKFEKQFYKLTKKPVYAFDPTLKTTSYITNELKGGEWYTGSKHIFRLIMWQLQEKNLPKYGIHFIEEGLAGSNSGLFKTLDYHLSKYNLLNKKFFLKIDIEGSEYDVLKEESFYNHVQNVVQMVFEFHYVKEKLPELAEIMKRLSQTHSLIHIHANNNAGTFDYNGKNVPEVLEVVFLHNSFLPQKELTQKSYPVEGLDFPCNWRRKDVVVDFFT